MFTIEEILEATGARLISVHSAYGRGRLNSRVSGVSIDSRTIKPNELFIAIRGEHFNGHSFIAQALCRGAAAILISDARYKAPALVPKHSGPVPMVKVKNTVQALGALAYYHRKRFKIPVIAITGSNGKTTTKEMLSNILKKRFNVLDNPGTQNNDIGVPLAILRLRKRHNLAVIEIGANHSGEIDRLSWIIKPTAGIITNIGPSHLESFKNLKGVFEAKLELVKNLAKNGKLLINKDDRFLSQLKKLNFETVTFGLNRFSDFCGQIIKETENRTIFLLNNKHRIVLKTLGVHNVYNALASIACARSLGLSYNEIKLALALFKMPPMRMQFLNIDNFKIINDCYNSNPGSLKCALEFLGEREKVRGRKIVILGDMLELGRMTKRLHLDIGKMVAKTEIDFLITVGQLARDIASSAYSGGMPEKAIRRCENTSEAASFLRSFIQPKDVVLIKGSRAMKMENVVKCFTSSFTR